MMKTSRFVGLGRYYVVLVALISAGGCGGPKALSPEQGPAEAAERDYTKEGALRMIRASEGRLAPVYGPLAEHLVSELALADASGLGIDVGSGPGTLIIELCKRTKMHWINADINPHFFPHFLRQAGEHGFGGRVGAVRADAQDLPFRDDYADVIVSRGSFWLWPDKARAFGEIWRVLKPGGVAYIGRGLSENVPLDVAKGVRSGRGGGPRYDVAGTADELRAIMRTLGIRDYRVIRPRRDNDAGVNYGVWVEFRKP